MDDLEHVNSSPFAIKDLSGIFDLFGQAIKLINRDWLRLMGLFFWLLLRTVIILLLGVAMAFIKIHYGFVSIVCGVAMAYYMLVSGASLIILVGNPLDSIHDAIHKANRMIVSFLFLSLFTGIIVAAGNMFFVIPGIIISVYFLWAPFIMLTEDKGIIESISKSIQLTSGRFIPVLSRIAPLFLINFAFESAQGIVLVVAGIAFSIISFLYIFCMFVELSYMNSKNISPPHNSSPIDYITAAVFMGIWVAIIVGNPGKYNKFKKILGVQKATNSRTIRKRRSVAPQRTSYQRPTEQKAPEGPPVAKKVEKKEKSTPTIYEYRKKNQKPWKRGEMKLIKY